jgi:hypothetical protein
MPSARYTEALSVIAPVNTVLALSFFSISCTSPGTPWWAMKAKTKQHMAVPNPLGSKKTGIFWYPGEPSKRRRPVRTAGSTGTAGVGGAGSARLWRGWNGFKWLREGREGREGREAREVPLVPFVPFVTFAGMSGENGCCVCVCVFMQTTRRRKEVRW